MEKQIATRFPPSPTGYLHIGGLRTALYAYLFARKNKGRFLLRIEDTDQKRFVEGAAEHIMEMLKFFDLEYDEGPDKGGPNGPYTQSQRFDIYQKHAQILLDKEKAYYCFCTSERLDKLREEQKQLKQATMYDGHCRKLTKEDAQARVDAGEEHVIRQKIPRTETLKFKDLIRGNVRFEGRLIDDQVLVKSDGFPTYHLANVVDDHMMEVTHVIRGEEWLPSTPKHIWLYEDFSWEKPEFAHIPLLLNKDKTKLSKRQNDVSVEVYVEKGYQKEAILNFIAFLGWHPGGDLDNEVFTLDELAQVFSLEKVHKAGAVFDLEKLEWFDWQWRRKRFLASIEEIAKEIDELVEIHTEKRGHKNFKFANLESADRFATSRAQKLREFCEESIDNKYKEQEGLLNKALITIEEKILKNPKEINEFIGFYFEQPDYDKALLTHEKMKVDEAMAAKTLKASLEALEKLEDYSEEGVKNALFPVVEQLDVKNGQVFWPLRSACSGMQFSPGVFEVIWVLGKEESLKRIEKAIQKL